MEQNIRKIRKLRLMLLEDVASLRLNSKLDDNLNAVEDKAKILWKQIDKINRYLTKVKKK